MAGTPTGTVLRTALAIFEDVLDWSAEQVDKRLAAACDGDAAVEREVRRLLRVHPDALRAFGTDFSFQAILDQQEPPPPARVGVFALTQHLGRGGMGDVYRGVRDDGLFEQTVAVKFIRADVGGDAGSWFDAERRILARLRHPNIAAVIDGGAVERRPYLVMELVEGQPLDEHLVACAPSCTVALDLFASACAAVQFAHQNLVVHADLKPANILVDHDGVPKLTDFGVAALLTQDGDPASPRALNPVTHRYASPQRLAGEAPSVADDIYALGVILTDLLRGYPARRDLAAIAAKAVADQPHDRYATVAALTDDLSRYRHGRPVKARPPSGLDAAVKFVRRNPWATGASVFAVAALLVGLATTSILYVRAETSRRQAEARFTQVRGMAKFMLFDLYDQLEALAGTAGVRQSVAAEGKTYLEGLAREPDAPKDLKVEAAAGYARLARTQGFGGADNLGQERRSAASYRRAIVLLREALGSEPGNVEALTELGWANLDLAALINENPRQSPLLKDAQDAFSRALALRPDAYARLGQLQSRVWTAEWMIWEGQAAQGRDMVKAVLADMRRLPDDERHWERRTEVVSHAAKVVGDGVYYAGDMAGSLPWYRISRQVIEAAVARHGPRPALLTPLAQSWADEGDLQGDLGHRRMAVEDLGVAIRMLRRVLAFGPSARVSTALSHDEIERGLNLAALGRASEAVGDVADAEAYWKDRWAREPQDDNLHIKYVLFLRPAGDVYWAAGQRPRACEAYRQAAAGWTELDREGKVDAIRRRVEAPQAFAALRRCPATKAAH